MRQLTFRQVLVVPTLATLGLGLLLAAQDISFTGPMGMAAPIVEPALPMRIAMNTTGPNPLELPGFQEESDEVKATSQAELKRMAKENSGREDPFVPLMEPDPAIVVPTPAPPSTPEPLPPMPSNPKGPVKIVKRVIRVKIKDPKTGQIRTVLKTVYEPVSYTSNDEPEWAVTGIFSTGYDVFAILEQGDTTREVRSGDILDDNTQVLDVNSQSVTLYKDGRKYTKSIGEKSHE